LGDGVELNALSKCGVSIGDNVSILKNTIIECTGVIRNLGEGLTIGNNVGIAQNCFIQVRGKVSIGNDVIFGPGVLSSPRIISLTLLTSCVSSGRDKERGRNKRLCLDRIEGDNLDGVNAGKNSVVAAASVVTRMAESTLWAVCPQNIKEGERTMKDRSGSANRLYCGCGGMSAKLLCAIQGRYVRSAPIRSQEIGCLLWIRDLRPKEGRLCFKPDFLFI
jgi:acetyltransferase-like isoleucine patch superfamily enzyme